MTNKERLIEIANKYYSGIPTEISDKEYDELEKLVKQEDPTFNVKEHITYAEGLVKCRHLFPFEGIRKTTHNVGDNLRDQVISKTAMAVPKYDGSSIRAYYSNGELTNILSRSDEWEGVNQTSKLRCKVKEHVPQWVKYIDYELLVSMDDFGENARQKANGLVNSKYLDEDVKKYAIAMPFYVNEHEGLSYRDRMTELFQGLLVEFDLSALCDFKIDRVTINGKVYPIDGIVVYDDFESDCINKIFKFYSIESKITKITWVTWNRSDFGYYIPKLILEPVWISGKHVKQVSGGSVDTVFNNHMCIGAEVRVTLAGLTIPEITEVISYPEVENYSIPKCTSCGHELVRTSVGYRCENEECTYYVEQVLHAFAWSIYSQTEYAYLCQGGLGSIDGYLTFLRSSDEFKQITVNHIKEMQSKGDIANVILNMLKISRLSGKTANKIRFNIGPIPTKKEINNPFDWFLSERAKKEIKIKKSIVIKLLSRLNEFLIETCNLEILKEE